MPNFFQSVRTQDDDQADTWSDATGLYFDPDDEASRSLTRQELAADTDINKLLNDFNVLPHRLPTWGEEIDYNLDLATAYTTLETARRANYNVPEELRQKYPTWREVLAGAESGQYARDLADLSERKAKAAEEREKAKEPDKKSETVA